MSRTRSTLLGVWLSFNRIGFETAAGTGIVTRAVNEALPNAQIVATDINPAVVEFASQHLRSEQVTFQRADAQQLPFEDESFDLVLCVFGVMFFPDKIRAHAEARRVLQTGGLCSAHPSVRKSSGWTHQPSSAR